MVAKCLLGCSGWLLSNFQCICYVVARLILGVINPLASEGVLGTWRRFDMPWHLYLFQYLKNIWRVVSVYVCVAMCLQGFSEWFPGVFLRSTINLPSHMWVCWVSISIWTSDCFSLMMCCCAGGAWLGQCPSQGGRLALYLPPSLCLFLHLLFSLRVWLSLVFRGNICSFVFVSG